MKRPVVKPAQDPFRAPRGPGGAGAAGQLANTPSDLDAAARVERRLIDGLAWTFRQRLARTLEALPAAAWADPAGQGWQEIKHNASRAVWRARIDGVVYYVKYYARQSWAGALKHALRGPACEVEFQSGVYALRAGIPAVRPVGYTDRVVCAQGVCSLLVTQAVEPAYPLSQYWETLRGDDAAPRRRRDTAALIDRLAEMIARAHQSGFEHRDMHAANILVHPVAPGRYETVLVDLQSARLGVPLSDRAVVRNLVQLNQWFRRHSGIGDRLRFLRRYLRWRNEYEQAFEHARPVSLSFEQLVQALIEDAERHAERLWAKRDRRVRRTNRYFTRIKVAGGWRGMAFLRCKRPIEESPASSLVLDREWWRGQLSDPLRWFEPGSGCSCKQSHSALVTRAALSTGAGKLPVIVKRPLARNWRRRCRQLLAPSRSVRGWRIGNALLNRDIPAARPLAVLERRMGPLVLDSVLLTEVLPGAADLDTHLRREFEARSPAQWWRHKRELSGLLARLVRQLAERSFVHRDCKAQNVLVVTQPRLKLLWIDMDGVKRVGRPSTEHQLRALMRLQVSLLGVPGLTRTDRLRFLKGCLGRFGSDGRAWREVWCKLSAAGEKKIRAKQLRRQWKLKHYGRA